MAGSLLEEFIAAVHDDAEQIDQTVHNLYTAGSNHGDLHIALELTIAAQQMAHSAVGLDGVSADQLHADVGDQIAQIRIHAESALALAGLCRSLAETAKGRVAERMAPSNQHVAEDAIAAASNFATLSEQVEAPISQGITSLPEPNAHPDAFYAPMQFFDEAEFRIQECVPYGISAAQYLRTYAGLFSGDGSVPNLPPPKYPDKPPATSGGESDVDEEPYIHDARVKNGLPGVVKGIKVTDVMTPQRRHKLPDNPDAYGLVAITSPHLSGASLKGAGDACQVPDGVESNYKKLDGKPFLDAAQAVALTYTNPDGNPEIGAIASAGVDLHQRPGTLLINQIQTIGLSGADARAGLYAALNALNWRKTLVMAWERVAVSLGMKEIVIQAAENSRWFEVNGKPVPKDKQVHFDKKYHKAREPERRNYDTVAKGLGYTQDPDTKNWHKRLD